MYKAPARFGGLATSGKHLEQQALVDIPVDSAALLIKHYACFFHVDVFDGAELGLAATATRKPSFIEREARPARDGRQWPFQHRYIFVALSGQRFLSVEFSLRVCSAVAACADLQLHAAVSAEST